MLEHKKNRLISAWFQRHAKVLLQKNFRKISFTKQTVLPAFEPGVPVIALSNHSSWWDAMLVLYLTRYVFKKPCYGVMAEEELRRYGIFRLVGLYGIERGSPRDAKLFLDYSEKLLQGTGNMVWLFPQGDIVSPDAHEMVFKSGFAHIVSRLKRAHILKMSACYDFWNESKPEITMDILPLETVEGVQKASVIDAMTRRVAREMSERLATVRTIVRERKFDELNPLYVHDAGTHPVYDAYRAAKAALTGQKFRKAHGTQ